MPVKDFEKSPKKDSKQDHEVTLDASLAYIFYQAIEKDWNTQKIEERAKYIATKKKDMQTNAGALVQMLRDEIDPPSTVTAPKKPQEKISFEQFRKDNKNLEKDIPSYIITYAKDNGIDDVKSFETALNAAEASSDTFQNFYTFISDAAVAFAEQQLTTKKKIQ